MPGQMSSPETVDEIPWSTEDPPERVATSTPRRCRHRRDRRITLQAPHSGVACGDCGHLFDAGVVRQNRNNRKRGNAIERTICDDLGVTPRGRYGDPVDGGSDADPYLVQVKSGGYFKREQQAIIDAMNPQRHGRPAILVTVETPGPGRKARALVTMTYEDFKEWMPPAENPAPANVRPRPPSAPTARRPFGIG